MQRLLKHPARTDALAALLAGCPRVVAGGHMRAAIVRRAQMSMFPSPWFWHALLGSPHLPSLDQLCNQTYGYWCLPPVHDPYGIVFSPQTLIGATLHPRSPLYVSHCSDNFARILDAALARWVNAQQARRISDETCFQVIQDIITCRGQEVPSFEHIPELHLPIYLNFLTEEDWRSDHFPKRGRDFLARCPLR